MIGGNLCHEVREGLVGNGINSHSWKLLFQLGVPIILDVVVSPARQADMFHCFQSCRRKGTTTPTEATEADCYNQRQLRVRTPFANLALPELTHSEGHICLAAKGRQTRTDSYWLSALNMPLVCLPCWKEIFSFSMFIRIEQAPGGCPMAKVTSHPVRGHTS